jgi:predicted 3-demethylubiquinone-9 3-methyltransferase (glyoxalase superfamily)
MPQLTTCLWFDTEAEEAAKFYVSVFPNSRITKVMHYTSAGPRPEGSVLLVTFDLDGKPFMALNAGPEPKFNHAVSVVVDCKTQDELDGYWEKLSAGGAEIQCGWLTDKYGLAWQVAPSNIDKLFGGDNPKKAAAAMKAMFGMKKLDIAALQAAYDAA